MTNHIYSLVSNSKHFVEKVADFRVEGVEEIVADVATGVGCDEVQQEKISRRPEVEWVWVKT
jgi:hypothetical protein